MKVKIALVSFCILILVNTSIAQVPEIVLSSRWLHPRNLKDSLSTISSIKIFNAKRVEWMYYENNLKALDQLKMLDIDFSLAINPQIPDSNGFTTVKTRMIDSNGNPYIAPWMSNLKSNKLYWGCVNNPQFESVFIKESKMLITLGAYGVFVDDSRFNNHAVEWGGGCFCTYCLNAFKIFLRNKHIAVSSNFNYRQYLQKANSDKSQGDKFKKLYSEFQTSSVVSFLLRWKQILKEYHNGIILLTNNSNGSWNDIYKVFDVGIAEMSPISTTFKKVRSSIDAAKNLNKKQIISFASSNQDESIAFYLYSYLQGSEALIPWDLWPGNVAKDSKRLFIDDHKLIPIVNFVRSYKTDFDKACLLDVNTELEFTNADYSSKLTLVDGTSFIFLLNQSPSKPIEVKNSIKYDLIFSGNKKMTVNRQGTSYIGYAVFKLHK